MSATYIAGIAASGAWDTAGESIDIKAMDISSLEGAVLNWEHESKKSSDYVGKVLKAKKIFSAKDCANETELKFWNKCEIPFLFCLGVLFNEYQPAAMEVAGIFDFDAAHPELPPTLYFSIEGAKQEKVDGIITHSIARKLTITATPANKTCHASKISLEVAPKDPLDFLFKSASKEIELFGLETLKKSMTMPQSPKPQIPKPSPTGLKQPSVDKGSNIGKTKAGHDVFSHEKVHNYSNFNAEDHRNAAVLHGESANNANAVKNSKLADHHNQKMKLHNQAAAGLERKAGRLGRAFKDRRQKAENASMMGKKEDLSKALTASGAMVAPGELTGGAALQSENIVESKKKKHDWLARAEEEYQKWPRREQFEKFMKSRMPLMTKAEVAAFGKVLALKKSVNMEKSLEDMMKAKLVFGDPNDQSHLKPLDPNPKKPEPKKKAPEVKAPMDGEVSHTSDFGADHETVHLKSGHEVGGVKKGRFKAGDKVHVKPHLMGTVLIDHKK